jgi:phosphohistidine swiveling domain-containing protein
MHAPRWDPAPLEESLHGARRLTVSVMDLLVRDGWETLARETGIPPRRWRRHHPLGTSPLIALVEGQPAFDAAAWERFVSLVPGAAALPSRTAQAFGVPRSAIRPPDRRLRLLDLLGARRRRRRFRRLERDLEAEHARYRASLEFAIDAALAPGDESVGFDDLPAYALAARLDDALDMIGSRRLPMLVDLLSLDATTTLVATLASRGLGAGPALLEAARLQSGGGIDMTHRPGRWHAMRELLLEASPLGVQADAIAIDTAHVADQEPPVDEANAAAVARARRLTSLRERVARDRGDAWAALRGLTWTLARRLDESGSLPSTDATFDLTLDELLRAARGVEVQPRDTPIRSLAPVDEAPVLLPAELRGIPASRGIVRGRVLVVDDPSPLLDVSGAIIVCRMTDAAWMPLLARCAGLVTERGGPLSHAAIIARELQLPTVVAVAGACHAASSAAIAEIDGSTGIVILEPDR